MKAKRVKARALALSMAALMTLGGCASKYDGIQPRFSQESMTSYVDGIVFSVNEPGSVPNDATSRRYTYDEGKTIVQVDYVDGLLFLSCTDNRKEGTTSTQVYSFKLDDMALVQKIIYEFNNAMILHEEFDYEELCGEFLYSSSYRYSDHDEMIVREVKNDGDNQSKYEEKWNYFYNADGSLNGKIQRVYVNDKQVSQYQVVNKDIDDTLVINTTFGDNGEEKVTWNIISTIRNDNGEITFISDSILVNQQLVSAKLSDISNNMDGTYTVLESIYGPNYVLVSRCKNIFDANTNALLASTEYILDANSNVLDSYERQIVSYETDVKVY